MAVPTRKDFVNMDEREALQTLKGLGFDEAEARTLADHFTDAERRG
jgi:LDH2 family malate/lactate/ureidoglycolate dehydrogenase